MPTGESNGSDSSKNRIALPALVTGAIAIGASPIFVRVSEIGPMATAFWRVALACLALVVISLASGARSKSVPKGISDALLLALPGFFLAADLLAWHASIFLTTVTNATLLANLAPVFVVAIGVAFMGAHVSRQFVLGLIVAVVGIVVLKGGPASLLDGGLEGDLLAVMAAAFYAGYMLSIARLRSRFDTLAVMIWSSASAAFIVLPVAVVMEPNLIPLTLKGWIVVAGLALFCHAGGQMAISYALAYLPPTFSSLTLLLQPVVATVLGLMVLGEKVEPFGLVGGTLVLAGIWSARRT